MSDARMMIHFPVGERLFNHRVAGVALRDGHVLVCREGDDDFTLLPGGRVEFGESSRTSLEREVAEEMQPPARVGRLLFTVENFFERAAWTFHEIALYYELILPDEFPFVSGESSLVTEDGGQQLFFDWVPADAQALGRHNLLPQWIRSRFEDLPEASEHLIIDERRHV
jgi:ADP-ribose pyrophosphatase YjhB (NUDIX family)